MTMCAGQNVISSVFAFWQHLKWKAIKLSSLLLYFYHILTHFSQLRQIPSSNLRSDLEELTINVNEIILIKDPHLKCVLNAYALFIIKLLFHKSIKFTRDEWFPLLQPVKTSFKVIFIDDAWWNQVSTFKFIGIHMKEERLIYYHF